MKHVATLFILHIFLLACGQVKQEQKISEEQNINLLPKFGGYSKTKEQKEIDQKFIDAVLRDEKYKHNRRIASDDLIKKGFEHLYKDPQTAMKRFNQAYLIDSTNTDIYWGYGAVFMVQGNLEKGKEQYERGLQIDPTNSRILTDLGTYYLIRFEETKSKNEAKQQIDKAIKLLQKSYDVNDQDQNTLFKLSVSHVLNNNCTKAREFYGKCMALGGEPITQEFTEQLENLCKGK